MIIRAVCHPGWTGHFGPAGHPVGRTGLAAPNAGPAGSGRPAAARTVGPTVRSVRPIGPGLIDPGPVGRLVGRLVGRPDFDWSLYVSSRLQSPRLKTLWHLFGFRIRP